MECLQAYIMVGKELTTYKSIFVVTAACVCVCVDMQAYEAIRWALELLNKKDQILNGDNLTSTYVPGIKLGEWSQLQLSDCLKY